VSIVGALALVAFAGGGVAAATVITRSVRPQWSRIVRLALGNVEPAFTPIAGDRWRSMHLAADSRRPFQEIRADNEPRRRGLPGWMVR
jgi:hypothetical protein